MEHLLYMSPQNRYLAVRAFFAGSPRRFLAWVLILFMAAPFAGASAENAEPSLFAQEDAAQIARVNQLFLPAGAKDVGTYSFHHNRKTKKVIVFIHGLSLGSYYYHQPASEAFHQGHNAIVANIPGHSNSDDMIKEDSKAGLWYLYAEYIARLAKHYGEEVIFVGHSLGAQLSARMAEAGLASKIILIQPLMGLSALNRALLIFANTKAAGVILEFTTSKKMHEYLTDYLVAAHQAMTLPEQQYKPISDKIGVVIYVSDYDYVISNEQAKKWAQVYAPQAQIITSKIAIGAEGHTSIPTDLFVHY